MGHHKGSGRQNSNGVDLNRAFPSWDDLSLTKEEMMLKSEPEVAAVIDWVFSQPFVLSANFHDGAVVASYPYDDSNKGSGKMVYQLPIVHICIYNFPKITVDVFSSMIRKRPVRYLVPGRQNSNWPLRDAVLHENCFKKSYIFCI